MATKRDVSKEQNERHKRVLKVLLKKEENKFCADCHARGPTWASTNLGVFVCLTCSGVHRSLGVHISVVRSTNLDTWLPDQVAFIQRMDNVKANGYWEASLPSDFRRPRDSEQHKLERFIQDKYQAQSFRDRDMPPPTIQNYKDHPLTAADTYQAAPSPVPARPAAAAAIAAPGRSAAPAVAKPEPPVQMLADLLSLDEGPPPPSAPSPAPAAAAPPATAQSNSEWADFGGGGDADPFASPAQEGPATPTPPASAPAQAASPAGPFASVSQPEQPAPAVAAAAQPDSDPFAALAAAPNGAPEPAASTAKQAPPSKMTNDDIMKLFDAAPPAQGALGQPPAGYGGYLPQQQHQYGMHNGNGFQPQPQQPQYAMPNSTGGYPSQPQQPYGVPNSNGYPTQPQQQYGMPNGNGYPSPQHGGMMSGQMPPQQQAYMMQQQLQQAGYGMQPQYTQQQQQYGAGAGGYIPQQQPGYGMPPGAQWGQPPSAQSPASQHHDASRQQFADFASFH
mmetsp:Transcript_45358/g.116083  ORF Transcript_45358/g.116083 Transcript_45358/m.116083 type:complete len:506 (-) Transcript_45358:168-1685(-)|eukprot:jgi/Tetstr1/426908/TSEL_017121.t1